MGHKYSRGSTTDDAGIYKKNMLPIGEDGGIPIYISKDGKGLKLHGRSLLLNRNFEYFIKILTLCEATGENFEQGAVTSKNMKIPKLRPRTKIFSRPVSNLRWRKSRYEV